MQQHRELFVKVLGISTVSALFLGTSSAWGGYGCAPEVAVYGGGGILLTVMGLMWAVRSSSSIQSKWMPWILSVWLFLYIFFFFLSTEDLKIEDLRTAFTTLEELTLVDFIFTGSVSFLLNLLLSFAMVLMNGFLTVLEEKFKVVSLIFLIIPIVIIIGYSVINHAWFVVLPQWC